MMLAVVELHDLSANYRLQGAAAQAADISCACHVTLGADGAS